MRARYNKHTEQTDQHSHHSEHTHTHTPLKAKLPSHSQSPSPSPSPVTNIITPLRAHTATHTGQIDAINPLSLAPGLISNIGTMGQIPDNTSIKNSPDSLLNSGNPGSKIRTDGCTGAQFESVTSSPACTTTASATSTSSSVSSSSSSSSSSSAESFITESTPHKDNGSDNVMSHQIDKELHNENHSDTAHTDKILDSSISTSTPNTTPLRGTGRSSSDIGGWGEVHLVADHSDEDEGPVFITNPMGERRKKSTESTVSADTVKFDDEKPFFMDNPLLSGPSSRRHSISTTPPLENETDEVNEMQSKRNTNSENNDKKNNKKKGKKTATTTS